MSFPIAIDYETCRGIITLIAGWTGAGVENAEALCGLKGVVIDAGLAIAIGFVGGASSGVAEGVVEEVASGAFGTGIGTSGTAVEEDVT